jgi:hypothetical protein
MPQFGSLQNMLIGSTVEPQVGMGATIISWTDRDPATIIAVSPSGRSVIIQEDYAEPVAGHCNAYTEAQRWTFKRNGGGHVETYSKRKDGSWRRKGERQGQKLVIGHRDKYRDPHF